MTTFTAQQVTRSHTIHLPAALSNVFPLFTPLGEKHWAPGWNPDMLYPASGAAQEGAVFTTQHPDEPAKIWTIIAYEEAQTHVTYINVLPSSHLSKVDVRCEADGANGTIAHITYTLTSLTQQGNAHLDGFTQEHYEQYISSWEKMIGHYLLHGHTLAH